MSSSQYTTEMRFLLPVLAFALRCAAQTPDAEVRTLVHRVFQSIRDGDREMGLKYFASRFEFYSPGGTTVPPGGDASVRRWVRVKGRANFVRHIQFVSP